ncbi:hypothetical protein KORDIASMS9_04577 [Kordia sp. SMS9]|uniref:DUF192 domain-containing protein n=1 Tax=Kordia sp. SMS9 TaxID=2282170 RepID=UPI000E0D37BD|nr:DUF192 domain-containing protein [Kordia sp. SMS9]AXG72306.1 hypothetical protein KORDIASMS9_04577 [Kordia sp. SMS9]
MKKFFVFLLVATTLVSCKESASNKTVKTADIKFTKEGELTLSKADGTTIATLNIEFAETNYERETGLMYRKSMDNNQAMLFIFDSSLPRSFYMRNTYIPLDIIYLDEHKKIVSIQENAQPLNEEGLPSEKPAMYVLEVNAGLTAKWSLEAGDRMTFQKL